MICKSCCREFVDAQGSHCTSYRFINIVLTMMFLWPIIRSNLSNPRLKMVAFRTLVASGVALTTSTVSSHIHLIALYLSEHVLVDQHTGFGNGSRQFGYDLAAKSFT